MKIDFIKNTKRNVLWGFINKAVMILFPFLNILPASTVSTQYFNDGTLAVDVCIMQ